MQLPLDYSGWISYWFNFWVLKKKPKIDHTNAKWKIVKTSTNEAVFFSNKPTLEEAKAEAWTAFNINKEGVRKAQTAVDLIVIENPHRKVDDDGYDLLTGLKSTGENNE